MTTLAIAGSGQAPATKAGTWAPTNANTSYQNLGTFSADRTGYWILQVQFSYDNGASQADLYTRWNVGGSSPQAEVPYIWTSRTGVLQAWLKVVLGAGQIVYYQCRSTNGGPYLGLHDFTCTFVPTPDYRI